MTKLLSLFLLSLALNVYGNNSEDLYGAIAVDIADGELCYGFIYDASSESEAEDSAVRLCKKYGGKKPSVDLVFWNCSGAIAFGGDADGNVRFATAWADSPKKAKEAAIKRLEQVEGIS